MNQEMIRKYAEATVRIGANVQPGQPVVVYFTVFSEIFIMLVPSFNRVVFFSDPNGFANCRPKFFYGFPPTKALPCWANLHWFPAVRRSTS